VEIASLINGICEGNLWKKTAIDKAEQILQVRNNNYKCIYNIV